MPTVLDVPIPFGGGVQIPPNKAMSLAQPIKKAMLPERLILPLRQHMGITAEPIVSIGDHVYKGQCIAHHDGFVSAPVHASSSGKIVDFVEHPVPSPSGHMDRCIVIETDGDDRWYPGKTDHTDYLGQDPVEIYRCISAGGIVGMGGAGFPAAVKLIPGLGQDINVLILNAVECEPYISCDEALIQDKAQQIITGLEILYHAVQPGQCIIGIEDSMPGALAALEQAIKEHGGDHIMVRQVATNYPAGGERQLIKSLTGVEVPAGGVPLDINILIYNVATVYAIYNMVIKAEPLISRLVTVSGPGIAHPGNIEVLLGTPIKEVIAQCGGYKDTFDALVIGGPMMGFRLHQNEAPVTKTTNCLLAIDRQQGPSSGQAKVEKACIRCGDCISACPAGLLPQDLLRYAVSGELVALEDSQLFDCIECGCCAYVCPSHIPLVDHYRHAKALIWQKRNEQHRARIARERFQAKQARTGKAEPELVTDAPSLDQKKADISAAVRRIRQRRAPPT